MTMIPENREAVILLDALDQLSPTDNAHSLNWLPGQLPTNVRIVASVLDREGESGACLRTARAKLPEESLIDLEPMTLDQGAELLDKWLSDARRTLQLAQRDDILQKFASCPMPLYLKVAFEEARNWRPYDGLPRGRR